MLLRVAAIRTDVSDGPRDLVIFAACVGCYLRANSVPSSQILVTLMMKALGSSETTVLTRATRRNTPEDGILLSHLTENLKSYI
jgi:hypothetical protein